MPTGTLLPNYSHARGFGFIKQDDGGPDMYVHARDLARGVDESQLVTGVRLSYHVVQGDRGPRAVRVRVLPPDPPPNGHSDLESLEAYTELRALFDEHERALFGSVVDWARRHGLVALAP